MGEAARPGAGSASDASEADGTRGRRGAYLSGAKAHVEAQLAEVDALLSKSGYDLTSPAAPRLPGAEASGSGSSGGGAPKAGGGGSSDGASTHREGEVQYEDTQALYRRALQLYGVEDRAKATRDKVQAMQERSRERRREMTAQLEGSLPLEYQRRPGTSTSLASSSSRPGTASSTSRGPPELS